MEMTENEFGVSHREPPRNETDNQIIECLTTERDINGLGLTMVETDVEALIDRAPRYSKWEIENKLYQIIDNDSLWFEDEDMGSAYKIINLLLERLE